MTRRALSAALLLVAVSVFAEPLIMSRAPFTLRVVDAQTGDGAAGLRIITDNGITCYTLLDGTAAFGEQSLMGRPVRFRIEDDAHRFKDLDTTLVVARRAGATLVLTRR